MASEWREVQLGDVAGLMTGYPFKSQYYTDDVDAPRLIGGDNIAQGNLRWDSVRRWPRDMTSGLEDYWLEPGDVVLAMDRPWIEAGLKRAAVGQQDVPALLIQRTARLRGTTELDTVFLRYVIGSQAFTHYILSVQTGTAIPHISPTQIRAFRFPLPPLKEQRVIAETLGALDDRIDNLRHTNATLQAIAAALFKSRFVDFDGVPPEDMQESELGAIPKGWRVASVGEYFDLTMGQSPPGDTYNETGEGIPFYQGRADFGTRFPTKRVYCTAPTRLAKKGDVLVSVRAPVGDINIALADCAIGRGVAAVHHEHTSFALYVMQSLHTAFKQFESEGTVFGSINKKQFEALQFAVPPDEVVREFQSVVQPMDARIENNEMQMRTLAALRDTLLPRLISGQLRIPDAQRIEEKAA